jgi:predicted lipid-binding transport protein (Tim44 family)
MNVAMIQILVLAGIAVFLVIRLKSVLGTRDGFEGTPPELEKPVERKLEVVKGGIEDDTEHEDYAPAGSEAAKALSAMKKAEPGFGIGEFLTGAKQAYEMILMAFENGDLTEVRPFISDEIAQSFQGVIDMRAQQGVRVEVKFIGVRELSLHDAQFYPETGLAEVTVKYVGELTSAVYDANGNLVEGDPKEVKRQRDKWTYSRKMGTQDANWTLVATSD